MTTRKPPDRATVEKALREIFIQAEGIELRREDLKKAQEVTALLAELGRVGNKGRLVDAAAGRAYVGILAAQLLGFSEVTVLERDASRLGVCRSMAERLRPECNLDVRVGEVGDVNQWPRDVHAIVALHACAQATDDIIDVAIRIRARWLWVVPCCYSASVPFAKHAQERAERDGIPRQAEIRKRYVHALIDAERTLRLESGGFETTVVSLVAPTVTPHNLLFRARFSGEPVRMQNARARWEQMVER
jgi:hypothetical protein